MRLLILLLFTSSVFASDYDRKHFKYWIDADRDCQDTRAELLISSSVNDVEFKTVKKCLVVNGGWQGLYSGEVFTIAGKLDVDHIVPLKEAWLSGADKWTDAVREAFANDPDNLIAVKAGENRSKGARDPAHWLPSDSSYHCIYVAKWLKVKLKYFLEIDEQEQKAINDVIATCD